MINSGIIFIILSILSRIMEPQVIQIVPNIRTNAISESYPSRLRQRRCYRIICYGWKPWW